MSFAGWWMYSKIKKNWGVSKIRMVHQNRFFVRKLEPNLYKFLEKKVFCQVSTLFGKYRSIILFLFTQKKEQQ